MNIGIDTRQLGRRIKAARILEGYTQRDVCKITGIPLGTWKDYEQGRCAPSMDRLVLIMSVLPVNLDGLEALTCSP